jgi:uncharacterized iron-regulated membrane protein
MIRKIIFWSHLGIGVSLGLLILMLSVTGILLTFDNQIRTNAFANHYSVTAKSEKIPLSEVIQLSDLNLNNKYPRSVMIYSGDNDALRFSYGHGSFLFLDPYTGEVLGNHRLPIVNFMNSIFLLHGSLVPFFSMETRTDGQSITGIANLAALFLIISGLYLWVPKIIRWKFFKRNFLFDKEALNDSKKRDYNWHLVLGIWSSVPLLVITVTATFMEYNWALDAKDSLMNNLIGTEEQRKVTIIDSKKYIQNNVSQRSLDELILIVKDERPDWKSISLKLPLIDVLPASFTIDEGNGRQPQKRTKMNINQFTGDIEEVIPFSMKSKADQNLFLRFLHTGEVFGIFSQIIALVTTAASVIMIWCGIALAYRRLVKSK